MATRFRLNFEQIFGTSAQVLAGGTLTFCISGGAPDQLQTIYQDPALSVTKLNPVVLDSAGKHGDIWLDDPSRYRVILKDAAGIVQPGGDVDPVDAPPKPASSGIINPMDFGAVGDGETDDWRAWQDAVDAASDYDTIVCNHDYLINATVTLKPKLRIVGLGGSITAPSHTGPLFGYTPGGLVGYPGRIRFQGLNIKGPGNVGNCSAIHIDANAPFIQIEDCYITDFNEGVYLRDTYDSAISHSFIYACNHGIRLNRNTHACLVLNTMVDGCGTTALSANYGSDATEAGPMHNLTVIGGAFQNSGTGIWLEQCLEAYTKNTYFETNTNRDFQIGANDGGAYGRACFNITIDGFGSASPCAGDINIRIQHSVGVQVRRAAWDSGCSTTRPLLFADGFCDGVDIDILRHNTAVVTDTAPIEVEDFSRLVLHHKGRVIYGEDMLNAMTFGTMANPLSQIYQGTTPAGRRALTLQANVQDVQLRAAEILRLQDLAGNDYLLIDTPNQRVATYKPHLFFNQVVGASAALPPTPIGYWLVQINSVNVRIPYYT